MSMQTPHESRRFGSSATESKQRGQTNLLASSAFHSLTAFAMFLFVTLIGCSREAEKPRPLPPEVAIAPVAQQNVPVYGEWVAQLNGPVNADITPKVQGYLLQQNYQNGFFVKKGQLLFTLDPRQYQAGLDESKAQVATALANLSKADADVARDTPLAAQRAIPQKDLDTDISTQAAMKAQVQAAQAALDNAEL